MPWNVSNVHIMKSSVASGQVCLLHAFDGFLEEKFSEIVEEFNQKPDHLKIKLKQVKNYKVAYEEGLKAHKKGQGPHILQVYEVATLSMMLEEENYVPIGDLLSKYQSHFNPDLSGRRVRFFGLGLLYQAGNDFS